MTSQQRADRWLEVWQGLRRHGLCPAERDAVIEAEIEAYHRDRFEVVLANLRSTHGKSALDS